MIYYSTAWNSDKHLGIYYNQFMELIGDDDYACFTDGDAMFTTNVFGKQLEDIVARHPDCGLFTCRTNRIGCKWQRHGDWNSNDMEEHRNAGELLMLNEYDLVEDVTNRALMGGVLILISKALWKTLGGFITTGLLGVDNDIHYKAQQLSKKVYLMRGVYMMHWYRGGDMSNKKHLL